MTVTFLNERVTNLKFDKVKTGEFFIETDVKEITGQGKVSFVQRGYIAEI